MACMLAVDVYPPACPLLPVFQVDLSGEEVQAAFDVLDTGGGWGGRITRSVGSLGRLKPSAWVHAVQRTPPRGTNWRHACCSDVCLTAPCCPPSRHERHAGLWGMGGVATALQTLAQHTQLWFPSRRQERHAGLWGVGGVVAAEEAWLRVAGGGPAALHLSGPSRRRQPPSSGAAWQRMMAAFHAAGGALGRLRCFQVPLNSARH